mgnify:CR=1 FL=1
MSHYHKPKRDPIDYDGMGDFSRFVSKENRSSRSLENEIRFQLSKMLRVFGLRQKN